MEPYLYAMATADGRIAGVTSGPYLYVRCDSSVSDVTHYVDAETHEVKEKQPLNYDIDTEGLVVTVTGLPEGLTVETNGQRGTTDSKPLVITYDVPGNYETTLSGLPEYLDETLEVTVGDP